MPWARPTTTPNCTDITATAGLIMGPSSSPMGPLRPAYTSAAATSINPSLPSSSASAAAAPRSSKKRSRASRRAPTTVLTTDTSNFRAMVQEFTGIPAPPFPSSSSSSPFPRASRFDFFNPAASAAARSGLLRPFPQKIQLPNSPFSTSTINNPSSSPSPITTTTAAAAATTTSNIDNITTIASSTSPITVTEASNNTASNTRTTNPLTSTPTTSYQHQHQSLLNMQNPIFTFQSLLQSHPTSAAASNKYNLSNLSTHVPISGSSGGGGVRGSQGPPPVMSSTAAMADFNHIALEGISSSSRGGGSGGGDDLLGWMDGSGSGSDGGGDHGQYMRPAGGGGSGGGSTYGGSQPRANNGCKMNSAASDFHAENGSSENIPARGEGMVDSWICSSD